MSKAKLRPKRRESARLRKLFREWIAIDESDCNQNERIRVSDQISELMWGIDEEIVIVRPDLAIVRDGNGDDWKAWKFMAVAQ